MTDPMTRVRPFRALRYDPEKVALGSVLVPPYDVISDADRVKLYDADPHSAIRLELTKHAADQADTDYSEVRDTLAAWQGSGVLCRDASPSFYALRQTFEAPGGGTLTREGFFALIHLEDYERRIVRPHERTLAGPKADRLKILKATKTNLSSVFLLYEDQEQTLAPVLKGAFDDPVASAHDAAGVEQTLARIEGGEDVERIQRFLEERPVVIADGHHRYETALAYRDACRAAGHGDGPEQPHEWLLVYLANAFAPGSLLLPIHRLVKREAPPSDDVWQAKLPGWTMESVAIGDAKAIPELLDRHLVPLAGRHAFAADDDSGTLRIFSRDGDDELGVRVIHREVLDGVFGLDDTAVREGAVDFPKSAAQTAADVREGRGTVALYLNPLAPEDVFRVTGAGEVLPQKSTFFFPKLPTGLVFRPVDA